MTKVGIITNPGSHRNKGGLDSLRRAIAGHADVRHAVLGAVSDIPEILRDFASREVGLLAIVGGDGTVQATLTGLLDSRPFDVLPTLAVLPGGRTNMIAADAGIHSRRGQGMSRLLELAGTADLADCVTERRILRIDNVRGVGSQFGMFFGAAAICRAIQSCRRKLHPYGLNSNVASALTLAGSVLRLLSGRGGEDQICRGDEIGIALDNENIAVHSCMLLLATTLDRLLLGSRPFWTDTPGPLHFFCISYPPKRLALYVPRLLYGGSHRKLPGESYFSQDATSVRLKFDGPFTLDGEFFEAEPGEEIVLSARERAKFVQL
ncbi:MAG: diacylglycerol kinase family protein [Proteobacteria bacterium]|nr:diacylglycerol kinase family protein [Pseudomonadota bacterium]